MMMIYSHMISIDITKPQCRFMCANDK